MEDFPWQCLRYVVPRGRRSGPSYVGHRWRSSSSSSFPPIPPPLTSPPYLPPLTSPRLPPPLPSPQDPFGSLHSTDGSFRSTDGLLCSMRGPAPTPHLK